MMNHEPQYTWNGILEFLHKHHEQQSEKESLWFLQKKNLQDHIKELQARVTSLEGINSDLLHRNRMLEQCLKTMKFQQKNEQLKHDEEAPKMPERRPKPNKDQISKVLYSLGVKNLLQNIQKDINEKVPGSQLNLDPQKSNTFRQKNSLPQPKSSIYKEVQCLEGHQDGVRDLHFLDKNQLLISASEDCTLKLWDIKNPVKGSCLGTIRQHSGPVFTITEGDQFVLTGGMEGIIRCWNFDNVQEKKDVGRKNLMGSWANSQQDKLEPIWQLVYCPENKLVFSTSSEVAIKAFKLDVSEGVKAFFKKSYIYSENNSKVQEEEDIPTAICLHQQKLVAGYVTSHSLVHFDIETGKVSQQISFNADGQISTNKLVSQPTMLIGGFEDKMVRIFDKNRMTYSFRAHDDSVMSVALLSNMNEFFTCGHDGFVKLWDLRKFQAISVFPAHEKKYDESVHCLGTSIHSVAASGGADSLIKVFSI